MAATTTKGKGLGHILSKEDTQTFTKHRKMLNVTKREMFVAPLFNSPEAEAAQNGVYPHSGISFSI